MPYGKKLYKNRSKVYASDIIYDEAEEKLQSEINAELIGQLDALDAEGIPSEGLGDVTVSTPADVMTIQNAAEYPIKNLQVGIEPVQDLHGYDSPWPAGGGKNLLPLTIDWLKSNNKGGTWTGNKYALNSVEFSVLTDGAGNVIGVNVNGTASANTNFYIGSKDYLAAGSEYIASGLPDGASADGYCVRIPNPSWTAITTNGRQFTNVESTTKSIVIYVKSETAVSSKLFTPMICLSTASNPTTFAPHSNICPISGWTGANVSRTGKNLCPKATSGSNNGLTWTVDENGVISLTGTASANTDIDIPVIIPKGMTITFGLHNTVSLGISTLFIIYDIGSGNPWVYLSENATKTATLTNSSTKMRIRIVSGTAISGTAKLYPQIELGETLSSFTPYRGTAIPISWQSEAGTVYGGTLDVTTGVLTVTTAVKTFNGSETWMWMGNNNLGKSDIPGGVITDVVTQFNIYVDRCNVFKTASWTDRNGSGTVGMYYGASSIYLKYDSFTSEEDITTFLASNPMTVVYELATPIVYDLSDDPITEDRITTVLGTNNIWSDTGKIQEITYLGTKTSNVQDDLDELKDNVSNYVLKNQGKLDALNAHVSNLKAHEIRADGLGDETVGPADIVTINDAAEFPIKSLKVGIEPAQDLHGYDHPWPAGGGKNLLKMTVADFKTANTNGTWDGNKYSVGNIDYTLLTDDGGNITGINVSGTKNENATFLTFPSSSLLSLVGQEIVAYLNNSAVGIKMNWNYLKSDSSRVQYKNNIATYSTFTVPQDANVDQVLIYVDTSSAVNVTLYPRVYKTSDPLTAYAPYSNICPISGWTGANVTRTGKNLLNIEGNGSRGDWTYNCRDVIKDEGSISYQANGTWAAFSFFRKIKPGTYSYNVSNIETSDGGYAGVRILANRKELTATIPFVFTLEEETELEFRFVGSDSTSSTTRISTFSGIQLECDTVSTAYEPQQHENVEISWQSQTGTVYGGTLDVVTGMLTVKDITVTLSNLQASGSFATGTYACTKAYTLASSSYSAAASEKRGAIASKGAEDTTWWGSSDRSSEYPPSDGLFAINASGTALRVYDTDITMTEAQFDTKYGDMQVCYPLAAPQTYQLTPKQVRLLLGTNNIWSDVGPIEELTYLGTEATDVQAEITEFENKIGNIAKSISSAQEGLTAARNYTAGETVMVGNDYYEITANIPYGNSLVEGTNCKRTTVGDQLVELKEAYENLDASDVSYDSSSTYSAGTIGKSLSDLKSALNTFVRPNLLNNWYFVGGGSQSGYGKFPINSRGQTSYTGYGKCIDCWTVDSGVSLSSTGLTVSRTVSSEAMYQFRSVDLLKNTLAGKMVTASILCSNGGLAQGTATVPTTFSQSFYLEFNGTHGLGMYFDSVNGEFQLLRVSSAYEIEAIKIELGSDQTLAHWNGTRWIINEIPDYETELLRINGYATTPRPNLLDNWYFGNPVNQRGQSQYIGQGYTIDRWWHETSLSINPGYITIGAGDFFQTFESDKFAHLYNKTVTFTVYRSDGSLDSATFAFGNESNGKSMGTGGTAYSIEAGRLHILYRTTEAQNIVAMKLELGSTQTLAHLEGSTWVLNEIPDYDEQIMRCCSSTAESSDTYANKPYNELRNSIGNLQDGLAYVESGNTASRNYTAGQYICWKGVLYKASGAISSGASFNAGSGGNLTTPAGGVSNDLRNTLTELNNNLLWKLAPNYTTAYANAKTEIMLVGKGKISNNAYIALSLIIPKMSIDSIQRYWQNGDSYNGTSYMHLQAQVSPVGAFNLGLYKDANLIDEASYEWYYR